MLSPQQDAALKAVAAFLRDPSRQTFYLAGFAGTGKTTLARRLAEDVAGTVLFAAFTGKAASVLRSKGCPEASTLHSLIYTLDEEDAEDGEPSFVLNRASAVAGAALVIVDECSMVDEALGTDLLSFGTKVLVLGDPAQLPPVRGEGFFTRGPPDFMLTEIHRQARDNPIIRLSTIVREGRALQPGRYGESRVLSPSASVDPATVTGSDQVLVGRNRTRLSCNARIRALLARTGPLPGEGDKLVCLKNDRRKGLLNGSLWSLRTLHHSRHTGIRMTLASEDGEATAKVSVPPEFFTGREGELDPRTKRFRDQFTYGYALTVHKAQGSQWNDVTVFDESACFREHRARHLYTAVTRAAERVTVIPR